MYTVKFIYEFVKQITILGILSYNVLNWLIYKYKVQSKVSKNYSNCLNNWIYIDLIVLH